MRVEVLAPARVTVEGEGAFALVGPSASGKTLALRSLYAVYGALTNSPPNHVLVSIFSSTLKDLTVEKPCEKDECVTCPFEVSLEAVEKAVKEAWSALLERLGLTSLEAKVDGEPLTFEAKTLCKDMKIYTGKRSFLEMRCDGEKIYGSWRWCPDEEIPYPYDRLATEMFPAKEGLAIYLPPGRGFLGTKEECSGFLESQACRGLKGSELEVERQLLSWALEEGDYVFVEGIYTDEEYLSMLRGLLDKRKAKVVVIETRDERAVERLGLTRLAYSR